MSWGKSHSLGPECPFPRWLTLWRARHRLCTGHWLQSGCCGVHTVAPSSMAAWLKSPGRAGSTSCWARLLPEGNISVSQGPFGGTLPNIPHYPHILPELLGDKGAAGISTNASDTAQHPYYIPIHHTGHLTQRRPGVSLVWEERGHEQNGGGLRAHLAKGNGSNGSSCVPPHTRQEPLQGLCGTWHMAP